MSGNFRSIFQRTEIKFLITNEQKEKLMQLFEGKMTEDKYGKSTICNIYYDTDSYLLIRRSIEKPLYKEKLRLRSYGTPNDDSTVFIELKKKYDSVVYKRRISTSLSKAESYLSAENKHSNTQIGKEIDYMFTRYEGLSPKVFISYEREAFYSVDDPDLRMTFDTNILWRTTDLSLKKGVYGTSLLPSDRVLLEVKSAKNLPLWLTSFLSENRIFKTSFSKYGNVYATKIAQNLAK